MGSRSLGIVEQYYFERQVQQVQNNVLSCITLSRRLNELEYQQLYHDLNSKEFYTTYKDQNHRLLIGKSLGNFEIEDIYINDEDCELNNTDLLKLCQKYHSIKFSPNYSINDSPSCKLFIVNKIHLIFIANHLFFDGNSIVNFVLDLISNLNNNTNKNQVKDYIQNPIESYISIKPSFNYFIQLIFFELFPSWLTKFFKCNWFGKFPLKNHNLQFRNYDNNNNVNDETLIDLIHINKEKLDYLLNLCKDNEIKFTSLLIYLICISFEESYNDKILNNKDFNYNISIPVNLRPFLDLKNILFKEKNFNINSNCFVSGVNLNLPSINSNLNSYDKIEFNQLNLNYIQTINSSIHNDIKLKKPFYLLGMLNYINIKDFLVNLSKKSNPLSFELSNLGYMDFKNYNNLLLNKENQKKDKLIIKDVIFSQSSNKIGAYFNINSVSFYNGLNLTISYDKNSPFNSNTSLPKFKSNLSYLLNTL